MTSNQLKEKSRFAKCAISLGITLAALSLSFSQAVYFDAFNSGFSGPDESAHFVNSYFIWSFLTSGQLNDPLSYAQEFYTAYPRLSIGHWPPLYYLFTALAFLIFPSTQETAMYVNLLISSAPVFFVAYLIQQVASWRWALLAGLAVAIYPVAVSSTWFFMLDQAVALASLAAATCWHFYAKSEKPALPLLYGGLSALAILIKGNGWLLALFPVFHILIYGNWRLLRLRYTYLGAMLGLASVLPWYWFTAKTSAAPFIFQFGIEYAFKALTFNIGGFIDNLSIIGISFAVFGAIAPFLSTNQNHAERGLAITSISMILSTLTLQSLVPVALDERYLAPALPFSVILAVMGIRRSIRHFAARHQRLARDSVICLGLAAFLWPILSFLPGEVPQRNLRMADAAALIVRRIQPPRLVVVDGTVGAEGAFVAEFMTRTNYKDAFAIRGSKFLSRSDFMGEKYNSLIESPDDVKNMLKDLGAGAIVLARYPGMAPQKHNELLETFLNSSMSTYKRLERFKHLNREGITDVYVATTLMSPDIDMVRRVNSPTRQPFP